MPKPWERTHKKRREREIKARILIVCEGSKTEPNYFKSFKVTSAKISVFGLGQNTLGLIKEAIRLRDEADGDEKYDQVWCVFDKDDFPEENILKAFELARVEQIKVAYSNKSFELWYYLHFNYHDTALRGTDYIDKLKDKLGFAYQKNDKNMYFHLLDRQPMAIKNAKKLSSSYDQIENEVNLDPYTSVYLLVEELNKNSS